MTVSTDITTPPKSTESGVQIQIELAVQIQIEILVDIQFVPRNLSYRIWWILDVYHLQWNLS